VHPNRLRISHIKPASKLIKSLISDEFSDLTLNFFLIATLIATLIIIAWTPRIHGIIGYDCGSALTNLTMYLIANKHRRMRYSAANSECQQGPHSIISAQRI